MWQAAKCICSVSSAISIFGSGFPSSLKLRGP
jgi:hypothetical protein